MLDTVEAAVAELLRRAASTRAPLSEVVRDVFRDRELRPRQQKRAKDLFARALGSERLIDLALREATPGGGIAPQLELPVRVMLSRVLSGDLSPKAARARISWIDWDRVAALPEATRGIADPVARLALRGSLPDELAARLVAQYGAEADALVDALGGRPPVVLRANTLRCTRAELAARLSADGIDTRPTAHALHGLEVLSPAQLFRTPAYREGWFEMQDEASQLVAELVAPPPGGRVVDACAGAGGKALALAALLENRGSIVALDVDARRLGDLRKRARRAGASNLRAIPVPADSWPADVERLVASAHRVLVDAPCSGVGSLRRNPDMRWRASRDELRRLRAIQTGLLARVVPLLRERARVVYATCTVLAEENESVVEETLARFGELERASVVEILGGARGRPIADGDYLRMLPHRHGSDGFFAAVLRRRAV